MGTGIRRIILLTLGWEAVPKSVSIHGASSEEIVREPVPGILLQADGGWLLLDTGFNAPLIRDPALCRRFYSGVGYLPELPGPGEPLEETLDKVGVGFEDIYAVGLSHLHHDHAGGLKHFADRIPVHLQRAELDWGLSDRDDLERCGLARVDYDDRRIDWRLADGEVEIAPGVTAVPTSGHTPGHQSFVVDLDDSVGGGGYVFAFDAADLTENIEHERPIGVRVDVPPEATIEPIQRLKRIAAERGYPLIPGHDPHAWPQLTDALAERFSQQAQS
jgi:glyoxylase-like metal-dependent hydrolase (beta-lactamase superfamily II)